MTTIAEAMIPITMFIMFGVIVIAILMKNYHKRKLESQEILAAIEKGVEVKFPETRPNRLLSGLIWLFTGVVATLGMMMAMPTHAPGAVWVWGLLPVAVGASFLIVYRIESKEEGADQD